MTIGRISGTFTGTGASQTIFKDFHDGSDFNISIVGTWVATVELQRSFDTGVTWHTTDTFTEPVSAVVEDPGNNMYFRLECTAHTSGIITYVLGI